MDNNQEIKTNDTNATQKTKKCKYCQSDIPVNAKICPVCKKKQGLHGCLIAVIVVVALFVLIGIFGSSDSENEEVASLAQTEASTSSETLTETAATSDESDSQENLDTAETETSSLFHVGDILETEDLRISFISAAPYIPDNQFLQPKEGCEFWRFEFAFENISDSDQAISSVLSWECYADNMIVDQTWIGDENGLDGTLSPGRQAQGAIYFEIPTNAQSIELEYDVNFWEEDKIIFVAK